MLAQFRVATSAHGQLWSRNGSAQLHFPGNLWRAGRFDCANCTLGMWTLISRNWNRISDWLPAAGRAATASSWDTSTPSPSQCILWSAFASQNPIRALTKAAIAPCQVTSPTSIPVCHQKTISAPLLASLFLSQCRKYPLSITAAHVEHPLPSPISRACAPG